MTREERKPYSSSRCQKISLTLNDKLMTSVGWCQYQKVYPIPCSKESRKMHRPSISGDKCCWPFYSTSRTKTVDTRTLSNGCRSQHDSKQDRQLPIDHHSLRAANGSPIPTFGTRSLSLNSRLRRDFRWIFMVADFLHHFGLMVDLRNSKLVNMNTYFRVSDISARLPYHNPPFYH